MRRTLAVVAVAVLGLTACDAFDGDAAEGSADTADDGAQATVSVPAERSSPFCEGIAELNSLLNSTDGEPMGPIIVEAYTELLPVVPAEIADDFAAVLAALQSGTTTTSTTTSTSSTSSTTSTTTATESTLSGGSTSVPEFEEGLAPDDDPAARINAYVQFACTDVENNPGPPATEPNAPELSSTT